jgi:hypothetical protein
LAAHQDRPRRAKADLSSAVQLSIGANGVGAQWPSQPSSHFAARPLPRKSSSKADYG